MTGREKNIVHSSQLHDRIAGKVIQRGTEDYRSAWANNWNQLGPERYLAREARSTSQADPAQSAQGRSPVRT